jgi:hypothetical protein
MRLALTVSTKNNGESKRWNIAPIQKREEGTNQTLETRTTQAMSTVTTLGPPSFSKTSVITKVSDWREEWGFLIHGGNDGSPHMLSHTKRYT